MNPFFYGPELPPWELHDTSIVTVLSLNLIVLEKEEDSFCFLWCFYDGGLSHNNNFSGFSFFF
jgi:hypothetical protein